MSDTPINSRDFVNSLARGLDVLRTFSQDSRAMTLSEVAAKANLSRAGARRLLLTLVELGYASKDGRLFRLTPRYLALGQSSMSAIPLSEVADDCVAALANEFKGCVSLAIRDRNEIVHIASASSAETVIANQKAGTRRFVPNSISGRVFMAFENDEDQIILKTPVNGTSPSPAPVQLSPEERSQLNSIRDAGYLIARPGENNAEVTVSLPILAAVTREVLAVLTASSWRPVQDHVIIGEWLPVMRNASSRILEAAIR